MCAPLTLAQTTAAQLGGRITDQTGALVAGASVVVTNSDTGIKNETASNDQGNYTVPLLEPGTYQISINKSGFRPVTRSGVTLHVNQTARIDFSLELGTVTETVFVKDETPLLEATRASLGAVVENRNIVNLPLNGRNPFDLVFLTPGAQEYNRSNLPGNSIPLTNFSINGGPAMANEVLLDGIPDTSPQFNQFTVIPSIDAVQEFKVQTNNMSAEFGRTTGGVVNVVMKSGSNSLHGTLYDFLRNNAFDANNFFNNATGQTKPVYRYNQFGGSVGGPIHKDKTFFFGNYEGLRRQNANTFLLTMPRNAQRVGDFSQMRAQNGQPIQIYDPMTSRQLADGSYLRDIFPNDQIPTSRINPISSKILGFWPAPNLPGNPITGINNFISNAADVYGEDQFTIRIDHSISDNNRLFGRISWSGNTDHPPQVYGNIANPGAGLSRMRYWNAALNDTHVFSPYTFATFRVGFTRLNDFGAPYSQGYNAAQLGFPAYFANAFPLSTFPSITVNNYTVTAGGATDSIGPVAGASDNNISNSYTAQTDITNVRGKHVIKAGFEYRLFRLDGFRPSIPTFTFTPNFTQGPDPTKGSPTAGDSFAGFLLGNPSAGNVITKPTQDTQTYYYAAFIQDDYKITKHLTLNLGLRFEIENLRTDRYNRLNYLDFNSPSPLQVPGFPQLRGGYQFVGVNGNPREQADVDRSFSPRFGFAYQFDPKMVVRGGYGIFVAPRTGWDFNKFGQDGYSAQTSLVASIDGITPNVTLLNPYPNGFVQPSGSSLGMLTSVGAALSSIDRDQKSTYLQQWNFDIERTLPGDVVIDAAYAGSKGTHLVQGLEYDQLPDQYLSLGNKLIQRIPNPFLGLIPATQALGTPTITYGQLLRPYPQFTGFAAVGSTSGSSIYHSLQMRVEKRFAHGFNALVSYTNGKLIDDGSPGRNTTFGSVPAYQDNNDRRLERSISSQEISQQLSIAYRYELPFGPGKAFFAGSNPMISRLIGGWQINGIHSFRTGMPLALTTAVNNTGSMGGGSRPNSTGKSAELSGPVSQRLNRYFDTSQFTLPDAYTFGDVARTLPDVRGPGLIDFDFSLIKSTQIRERARLQFRAEAFNAFNHPNFGLPGTVAGSTSFGVINSAGDARILQLALKLIF